MEKALIVATTQVVLLDTGVIVKAMELKKGDSLLAYSGDCFTSCSVEKVIDNTSELSTYLSGQGRTLQCAPSTSFIENVQIDSSAYKANYITMSRYIPRFGDISLPAHAITYLAASLLYKQNTRPNLYTKQYIPLFLSKLSKSSLTSLLVLFKKYKDVRHLTPQSKNILIMLLEKLGIPFRGSNSHIADNRCGTITFMEKNKNIKDLVKRETIKEYSMESGKAVSLYFDESVSNVLIGGFLCQVA